MRRATPLLASLALFGCAADAPAPPAPVDEVAADADADGIPDDVDPCPADVDLHVRGVLVCGEEPSATPPVEVCWNGVDDDGDALVDHDDLDCLEGSIEVTLIQADDGPLEPGVPHELVLAVETNVSVSSDEKTWRLLVGHDTSAGWEVALDTTLLTHPTVCDDDCVTEVLVTVVPSEHEVLDLLVTAQSTREATARSTLPLTLRLGAPVLLPALQPLLAEPLLDGLTGRYRMHDDRFGPDVPFPGQPLYFRVRNPEAIPRTWDLEIWVEGEDDGWSPEASAPWTMRYALEPGAWGTATPTVYNTQLEGLGRAVLRARLIPEGGGPAEEVDIELEVVTGWRFDHAFAVSG